MLHQVLLKLTHRGVKQGCVYRAVARHHENSRGLLSSCQGMQKVDGGMVAPVQIFQPQDERRIGGNRLAENAKLTQHPGWSGRKQLRVIFRAGGGQEPG